MKKRSRKKTVSDVGKRLVELHPHEWDFRFVDERELMTVLLYEYTRSSRVRSAYEKWHRESLGLQCLAELDFDGETESLRSELRQSAEPTNADLIELAFSHDVRLHQSGAAEQLLSHLWTLAPADLFPSNYCSIAMKFSDFTRPWQQMRVDFGNDYLQARLLDIPRRNAAITGNLGPSHTYEHLLDGLPTIRHEELLIDWSYSIEVLTDAFRSWAINNRLQVPRDARPSRGRDRCWERLKWLAAHRLRDAGHSFRTAQDAVSARIKATPGVVEPGPVLPIYDRFSWSRAAKKADILLSSDFNHRIRGLFGLIDARCADDRGT